MCNISQRWKKRNNYQEPCGCLNEPVLVSTWRYLNNMISDARYHVLKTVQCSLRTFLLEQLRHLREHCMAPYQYLHHIQHSIPLHFAHKSNTLKFKLIASIKLWKWNKTKRLANSKEGIYRAGMQLTCTTGTLATFMWRRGASSPYICTTACSNRFVSFSQPATSTAMSKLSQSFSRRICSKHCHIHSIIVVGQHNRRFNGC